MTDILDPFDVAYFVNLLSRLCRIPGKTFQEDQRRNEIAIFLDSLSSRGSSSDKNDYHTDSAGNLIACFGADSSNPTWTGDAVVFDAHIDVVGKGFSEPFVDEKGRLNGLGTGDNLTSAALLCMLAERLSIGNFKFKRPLYLLFSVCEEGYGNLKGVRQFVDDRISAPHLFVSLDLSFREYSTSGLGSRRFSLVAKGPGGHSWDNRDNPSAIEKMICFLSNLRKRQEGLDEKHSAPFSFNIGIIEGGEGVNIIAGKAGVHFEFRSTSEGLLDEAARIVQEETSKLNDLDGRVRFKLTVEGERPAAKPVRPEIGEEMLRRIWKKHSVPVNKTIRSTNINYPLFRGWPCICTGLCECAGYHTEDEYIVLNSVETGWRLLGAMAKELVLDEEASGA